MYIKYFVRLKIINILSEVNSLKILDKIALVLVIIGANNWGLIGIFNFNLVDTIFGEMSIISRIVYSLVGISGLWCIRLLYTDND